MTAPDKSVSVKVKSLTWLNLGQSSCALIGTGAVRFDDAGCVKAVAVWRAVVSNVWAVTSSTGMSLREAFCRGSQGGQCYGIVVSGLDSYGSHGWDALGSVLSGML